MGTMASQITSLTIVYSIVHSGTDQRKHQSSASLAIMRGIHRGPVNSPHKWPVTRKMVPFDDVIMYMDHLPVEVRGRLCKSTGGPPLTSKLNKQTNNTQVITQRGLGKMPSTMQTTFRNAFYRRKITIPNELYWSKIKIFEFKFH